jgi:excisionase family DNA binding protein
MTEEQFDRMEQVLRRLERVNVVSQGYISIKQAATYTGLSPVHIRRAATGGTLPCSNVGTYDRPTYRISRKDIDAWMEKRKAGAFPPPRKKRPDQPQLPVSRHSRRPPGQPAA